MNRPINITRQPNIPVHLLKDPDRYQYNLACIHYFVAGIHLLSTVSLTTIYRKNDVDVLERILLIAITIVKIRIRCLLYFSFFIAMTLSWLL